MSLVLTGSEETRAEAQGASVHDYVDLLKPRVMSLVIFTALVGLVIAPVGQHPVLAATALLCIAVGAGAAGALNMWYDADIDALMRRTARRPIPSGRVTAQETLAFGALLAAGSVLVLGVALNWLAAALLAFTILFYVGFYTMWLKRRTPQNIVIGGAAGAFPPVVAWAAVTGTVSLEPLLLFLIIFLWTPPHFWALALRSAEDYRRAGVPMLPVVAGGRETRRQILLYSLALAASSLLPPAFGFAGLLYTVAAAVLGGLFVMRAWKLWKAGTPEESNPAAGRLFGFSILYLFVLFGVLAAERLLSLPLLARLW